MVTVYIRAYAEQTVTERTDVYRSTRFFAPKMFFRSFKVTNANIETKLEQMCCIHTRLVVCAQEHNDFSGGSPLLPKTYEKWHILYFFGCVSRLLAK